MLNWIECWAINSNIIFKSYLWGYTLTCPLIVMCCPGLRPSSMLPLYGSSCNHTSLFNDTWTKCKSSSFMAYIVWFCCDFAFGVFCALNCCELKFPTLKSVCWEQHFHLADKKKHSDFNGITRPRGGPYWGRGFQWMWRRKQRLTKSPDSE